MKRVKVALEIAKRKIILSRCQDCYDKKLKMMKDFIMKNLPEKYNEIHDEKRIIHCDAHEFDALEIKELIKTLKRSKPVFENIRIG